MDRIKEFYQGAREEYAKIGLVGTAGREMMSPALIGRERSAAAFKQPAIIPANLGRRKN